MEEAQPSPRQPGESEIDYLLRLKREGRGLEDAKREPFYASMRPRLRGYVSGEGARVALLLKDLIGEAESEPGATRTPSPRVPEDAQVVRARGKRGDDAYVHIAVKLVDSPDPSDIRYTMHVSGHYRGGSNNMTSLHDDKLVIDVNGMPTINLDELRAQILRFAGLA